MAAANNHHLSIAQMLAMTAANNDHPLITRKLATTATSNHQAVAASRQASHWSFEQTLEAVREKSKHNKLLSLLTGSDGVSIAVLGINNWADRSAFQGRAWFDEHFAYLQGCDAFAKSAELDEGRKQIATRKRALKSCRRRKRELNTPAVVPSAICTVVSTGDLIGIWRGTTVGI